MHFKWVSIINDLFPNGIDRNTQSLDFYDAAPFIQYQSLIEYQSLDCLCALTNIIIKPDFVFPVVLSQACTKNTFHVILILSDHLMGFTNESFS